MDDAGPPSLFVVAYYGPYYGDMDPPYLSILQLETPDLEKVQLETSPQQIKTTEVDENELLIIRFNKEPEDCPLIRWLISPPTSSTEDLYMVPNWGCVTVKPLQGYKFNLRAGMCEPITPPLSSELAEREGHVVNLGGRIYLLGYSWVVGERYSFFQCYDPEKKSWNSLEPFPQHRASCGPIVATAVLGDTILYNLQYSNIWAYDVSKNKWYQVRVHDKRLYYIAGEAVVLGDTIYALTTESYDLVLALFIEKEGIDGGDLVLKCSSETRVPGMKLIDDQDILPGIKPIDEWDQDTCKRTRHLVHLGKDKFCLVQGCNLDSGFNGYQYIKLTYIKLDGENSRILEECVHKVKWKFIEQFDVVLCFSLPKCKTTALKEGKGFNLAPFPDAVQEEEDEDNDSSQTDIIDGQLGRSVYVRELPSKVTVKELEMGLKECRLINTYRINEEGKHRAFVEFESAASKQLAIEASPIMIGDCPVILEQRLTDHILGGCNRTQAVGSSSFGKNKLKKPARSKTTWAGHNRRGGVYQPRRPKGKKRPNKVADLESQVSGFENDLKKVKERLENNLKEKERIENDLKKVKEQLENDLKTEKEQLENDLKTEKEQLENDLKKVKERLDFSKEDRNIALQDAEESNKQGLEMSSKLDEEAIDSKDEKKQALDQPKSKGTAVLKEDHVSLFESERIRRLRVESDQWRKAAEAYAEMLSTGNNGKLTDRSASTQSKCCPRSRERLRRILKMGRMI